MKITLLTCASILAQVVQVLSVPMADNAEPSESITSRSAVLRIPTQPEADISNSSPSKLSTTGNSGTVAAYQASGTSYAQNWAGAMVSGKNLNSASATFRVPSVFMPAGGNSSTQYGMSIWVGIDGAGCSKAILQTGIYAISQNGKQTYSAWYQWYPGPAAGFNNIVLQAGDNIYIQVQATSTTSGIARIQNLSRGTSVSHSWSNQAALCLGNAEWIVEDYNIGGTVMEPFPAFGQVSFASCQATSGSQTIGVNNALIWNMAVDQNHLKATGALTGPNSAVVQYKGSY